MQNFILLYAESQDTSSGQIHRPEYRDKNGQQNGRHEDTVLRYLKAIHLRVPAFLIPQLKANQAVKYISPNRYGIAYPYPGFQGTLSAALRPYPQPLFVGLHWPSLPWGEEELGDGSFAPGEQAPGPNELYGLYLDRLGDTPAVRSALRSILGEARRNATPDHLPAGARDAFLELNRALDLGSDGVGGAPDADREPFDPERMFEDQSVAFGGLDVFGGILGLLRVCSYWNMKKRARTVGEGGMHAFVNGLQRATSQRGVRIHLMGHSFGCIVISSILGGPRGDGTLARPIDSVVLAQGAVSLWSYASDIP